MLNEKGVDCIRCLIHEFQNQELKKILDSIAKEMGYEVIEHRIEIVGRRKNYYPDYDGREDALVMRRILINRKVNLV